VPPTLYLPAAQPTQAPVSRSDTKPAGQLSHQVRSSFTCLPVGHSLQYVPPVTGLNLPMPQNSHPSLTSESPETLSSK
jgi:hypothetical protein